MPNNSRKTQSGRTGLKSTPSKTVSIRLSLRDLDLLERKAESNNLSVGSYAKLLLIDDVRPVVGERSLAALSTLLRAASLAAERSADGNLASDLRKLCEDALQRIQDDQA